MKIIYILECVANIGGVERISVLKMNYLAEKLNHEVYLVTSSQGNHPIIFPLSPKVKHIDLNVRVHTQYQHSYPKRIWIANKLKHLYKKRLQQLVYDLNPDIIICMASWLYADIICDLKGKGKKVFESHCARSCTKTAEYVTSNIIKNSINNLIAWQRFRYIEKKSDAIVTLTKKDAISWKATSKMHIIPNLIEQIPQQSSTCSAHRVIAAGRLVYQKRFDRLIQVWEIVHKKHPEWRLDIYGEGKYKKQLENQIKVAHIEDVVTIYPFTNNIFQEYVTSSIFALSSNYEGFGLVLIEAMSCGIPCVSFDCPHGPSEIIKNKEDGLLIKNGDIKGFAKAICYLIENEKERKSFGSKAKENVKRYFPGIIIPQWERLFNELLKK